MLAEDFDTILHNLDMAWLEHPLFHHAPVAIRFEIGGDEPVYLECTYSDENTEKPTPTFQRRRVFCGLTGIPKKNLSSPC